MKRILFLIHDLGQGGAEKVLVNLVNHLNRTVFDVYIKVLFGGGVNEQFLNSDVHLSGVFSRNIPANSRWMKMFTPKQLHKMYIKEQYDIEVSYLEGPCARIISGCTNKNTKLVSWIHTKYIKENDIYNSFRSRREALDCYNRFDFIACVSEDVRSTFCDFIGFTKPNGILYNTIESEKIKIMSNDSIGIEISNDTFNIIAVGSLKHVKRFDRLLNIAKRLKAEGYRVHTYILGTGPLKGDLARFVDTNNLNDSVTLLGYDTNPYKYLSKCDLFVCSSQTEGFSTAATEALIVGTPVCTTEVSGMKELLGENNNYGLITENNEDALYSGIKKILDNPDTLARYKEKAKERGIIFSTEHTVRKVENMLLGL